MALLPTPESVSLTSSATVVSTSSSGIAKGSCRYIEIAASGCLKTLQKAPAWKTSRTHTAAQLETTTTTENLMLLWPGTIASGSCTTRAQESSPTQPKEPKSTSTVFLNR